MPSSEAFLGQASLREWVRLHLRPSISGRWTLKTPLRNGLHEPCRPALGFPAAKKWNRSSDRTCSRPAQVSAEWPR